MKTNILAMVALGICISATLACESKFSEKNPDAGNGSGTISLADRVASNKSLGQKLNEIESLAAKTKEISELFRKYQKNPDGTLYTPVDLLADISTALKKGIPEDNSGDYEKEARLKLPAGSMLSPECQVIYAKFTTSGSSLVDTPDATPDEHSTISIKTCKTNDQYVETFVMDGSGGHIGSVKVKGDALNQIFPFKPGGEVGKIRDACKFAKDASGKVASVSCQNLSIPINNVDVAILDTLTFDVNGDPRFEAAGTVYELGQPKLTTYLSLDKHGVPTIKFGDVQQQQQADSGT